MPRRIVAGNWKMHGRRAEAAAWLEALPRQAPPGITRVLFPPAVLLPGFRDAGHPDLGLGVQTIHPEPEGAFTGELSAEIAADAGAAWTLVGHSERRTLFGEDDAAVGERLRAARRAGLVPVLCVGETLDARRAGEAIATVSAQLDAGLAALEDDFAGTVIAYEPVWAIGTGESASPGQVQEMHAALRGRLVERDAALGGTSILYGGSIKPESAGDLFAQADVDGGLVGGASLDAGDFAAICAACSRA